MKTLRTLVCGAALAALLAAVAGCSPDTQESIEAVEGFGAYAAVSSDRSVVSVALLEPDGRVLEADFINSGSARAGLVTALSGDVALPTRSGDPGVLTLIDRFTTDVITRVDPAAGEVLGQVKTHTPNAEAGDDAYSSNPQDYVYVAEDEAWVSRFAPNPEVAEDHPDRGADLLRLDPTRFERLDERIGFGDLDSMGMRENPDTGEMEAVTTYARPGSIVRLGDHLVVGLAHLSLTFDAVGDGMVALVDLETHGVSATELPGLQNCPQVVPVVDDPTRVALACTGFFRGDPRATSGLAMLQLSDDGVLAVEHVYRPADDDARPNAVYSLVSLGGTRVLAVELGMRESAEGAGDGSDDGAFVIDLETGDSELLFEARGRYVIGPGSYDVRTGVLLLPDASADDEGLPTAGVRRYRVDDAGGFEALETSALDPILPVRQVMPL